MTETITVHGMSCEGCEDIVETALEEVGGVESADADREAGVATVEGDPDVANLVEAVDFAGYEGEAAAPDSEPADADSDEDADSESEAAEP